MFEDFDKSKANKEGRGRMGVSFLISAGIYAGIIFGLAAAIATARVVVKRKQRDVQVSFADLPRPPKPKPAKLQPGHRKAAARKAIQPPTEIPQERPEEADQGELADPGKVGPVEGFTDGAEGGTGAGGKKLPQQVTETVEEPKFVSGCRQPEAPDALEATAATIEIDVRMMIDVKGVVRSAKILKSHPLIPDDLVLQCARAQVFKPAHLPDGTPVPYPYHTRFVFLPSRA
jgi:hypothetical protein